MMLESKWEMINQDWGKKAMRKKVRTDDDRV